MEYALIAALLLVVILPALAVLPSPGERRQARMRQQATAEGVTVQLASLPALGKGQAELRLAAYRVQRPKEGRGASWCLQRRPSKDAKEPRLGGMAVQALPRVLSQAFLTFLETQVGKLPLDVEQVQEEGGVISIYWRERQAGTERQVIDFLKHCRSISA